jgi:hypothetical protein
LTFFPHIKDIGPVYAVRDQFMKAPARVPPTAFICVPTFSSSLRMDHKEAKHRQRRRETFLKLSARQLFGNPVGLGKDPHKTLSPWRDAT